MARNTYPEKTANLILEAAAKLFVEKGYEKTSIQDIMNVTGLSKGAIYYHFSSKENILERVGDVFGQSVYDLLSKVRDDKLMNGMEKIKEYMKISFTNANQQVIINMLPNLLDNPKLLAMQIKDTMELSVPIFLEPVIREGIKDGSIVTKHPMQAGEALLLMANMWISPVVFPCKREELSKRLDVLCDMMKAIGFDFFDEELRELALGFCGRD